MKKAVLPKELREPAPLLSRDRSLYKTFFSLLGFVALQNFLAFSVNMLDNIMLGNFSEEALSGAALSNQVQFLLQMVVNGVGEGLIVLAAQYWGTKRTGPMKSVIASALRYGMPIALVFFLISFFFPVQVLSLLSDKERFILPGAEYLRILSFTFPFFFVTTTLITSQRSVERVWLGAAISLCGLVINAIFNTLLIFGHLGFPRLGIAGAAYATLLARVVECTIAIVYVLRFDKRLSMKLRDFFKIDKVLWRDYVRVATPVVLSGASWGIAMSVQTAILGRLGDEAIGANSIATTLFQVITVVVYGGASASGIIIGKAVGQGDLRKVKEYTKTLQVLFIALGIATSLILFALKNPILSMYSSTISPQTIRLADTFILVLCVTVIGTAYQVSCLTGIVRGGGNTKFVFYNDLIFMWGIVLPSSLLGAFVFNLSPVIVFIFLKSDQILKCAVAAFEVNSYRWVRKLTRSKDEIEAQNP